MNPQHDITGIKNIEKWLQLTLCLVSTLLLKWIVSYASSVKITSEFVIFVLFRPHVFLWPRQISYCVYSEYAFKELGDVTIPPTQAPPPSVTTQAPPAPVTTEAPLPQVTTQAPRPPTTSGKQNIASREHKCSQATLSQCHCPLSSVGQSSAPTLLQLFFCFFVFSASYSN